MKRPKTSSNLSVNSHALLALVFGLFCLLPVKASPEGVVFNIRDFGAVGDGETLDHEAINRAILAAVDVGGGTVWIPAGEYLCGSIRLQSNIRLHLDTGATIIAAPQDMEAYDYTEEFIPPAYQDGGHTYFQNSLVWGIGLENLRRRISLLMGAQAKLSIAKDAESVCVRIRFPVVAADRLDSIPT